MDEDLKIELLQILRELKNGATPAFQELVVQRANDCARRLPYGSHLSIRVDRLLELLR